MSNLRGKKQSPFLQVEYSSKLKTYPSPISDCDNKHACLRAALRRGKAQQKDCCRVGKISPGKRILLYCLSLYFNSMLAILILSFQFQQAQLSFLCAQENPNEPMPKRIKKGGGPTPTITGQTESFLAELAGTMDLPLTPRQQEQRELWEPPLAPEVLALIKEDECGICDKLQLSSEVVAHGHYHGRKHEKRLLKMLADKGGKVPKKKGCIVAENTAWQQSMMSPLRCELCKVDFTGPACASLHYAGAKHQKRLNTANRMAEFNIEVEQEEVQPPPVEDRTFGIGTAFNQLSEADKERMEEVGKIEAMLAQAKSEATVAQGRQPAAALWGGLTEQDVELYTEGTMISPFYCTVCNIDCENQGSLDAHYRGKPHAKKVTFNEAECFDNI